MMTRDEIKDKLYSLHKASCKNLKQIKESTTCGCFSCGTIFKCEDIEEYCDYDGKEEKTAICPKCRNKSVLGDACGYEITPIFLKVMEKMFFGEGIDEMDVDTLSLALHPKKQTLNLCVFDQTCTYVIPSAMEASYRATARTLNSVYEEMKRTHPSFSQSELQSVTALVCAVRFKDSEASCS